MNKSVVSSGRTASPSLIASTIGLVTPSQSSSHAQVAVDSQDDLTDYFDALFDVEQRKRQATKRAHKERRSAIAAQRHAAESFAEHLALARIEYEDFCQLAGMLFVDPADRSTLSLNGKVSSDARKFAARARATYQCALEEPFAVIFALHGYDARTLKLALRGLDALLVARELLVIAMAEANETGRRTRRR